MVIWTKPKKTLLNILTFFAYISFSVVLFVALFLFIWVTYPQLITKFDNKIPNFYSDQTDKLYQQAKIKTDSNGQLIANQRLLNYLNDISDNDKHIDKKIFAYRTLSSIYLTNKNYKQALITARQWNKELPNDIDSYIFVTDALKYIDTKERALFIKQISHKFFDIEKIHQYYIKFLNETGQPEQAKQIALEFTKYQITQDDK